MAQKLVPNNRSSNFCSVIRVDKDISFVVDNDTNYSVTVPTDKNIGMSRKTYSKKHPITYNPCISFAEDSITVMDSRSDVSKKGKRSVKNSPKCPSESGNKATAKKRMLNTVSTNGDSPAAKKMKRKDTTSNKFSTDIPKFNGRINCKNKTLNSKEDSPDSDVEILEIKIFKPQATCMFKPQPNSINKPKRLNGIQSFIKTPRNSLKHDTKISSQANHVEVSSTKMPLNTVPENNVVKEADSIANMPSPSKSVAANEENVHSSMKNNTVSAKDIESKNIEKNTNSDLKVREKYVRKNTRELNNLYENLNEISWAHEKSFQQLLCTDKRHSERITAKVFENGKNMRRIKAGAYNMFRKDVKKRPTLAKHSASMALKKAKMGNIKKRMPVKPIQVTLNKMSKQISLSKVNRKENKPGLKPVKKVTNAALKPKAIQNPKINVKSKNTMKQRPPVSSTNKTLKDTADNSSIKNMLCPGSSGLQSALTKNHTKPEENTSACAKSTNFENLMKKYEKVDVNNEFEMFSSFFNSDDNMFSALKKGSNLRVTLEPLEHTNLWNADFYETFKRHILEQAYLQTLERREQDSISSMFQELHDSYINPNNQNNIKFNKKKKPEEETLRSSVRQSEGAFRYKEIVVKKHSNYMQFVLVPNPCKKNCLSIEAMKELKDAFILAKRDPNCRAVLINSSGTYFCSGIDLSVLVGVNKKQAAEEMASTIRDLVLTLSTFSKPVIAAVNGIAVGFGVALLTYCDIVLASDKATFSVPASRLGYLPEGAITLTLPQVVGAGVATEMLLHSRKLTAEQAQRHGLVSEVLWPTRLMNEVVPRLQSIVSQPLQVMEATKSMVRCHLWDKLKSHMEREWRLLPPLWLDAQCQHNMKRSLQTGWLLD